MPDTPSHTPELRLERDGDIGFVIASNPARMNAFTAGMWKAVPEVLAEAEADPAIRVIVLRGRATRAFSAGADISEFDSARAGDAAAAYDALNDAAFRALSGCAKPTIAMIHGFCLGGGLAIALCADIRLADDVAEFAIPAAKLGLGYNARWVRPLLAAVPPHQPRRCCSPDGASKLPRRWRWASSIPSARPPSLKRRRGRLLATSPPTPRSPCVPPSGPSMSWCAIPQTPDLASLDAAVSACFDSEDYAEGRRAFKEKRKPRFQGR